MMDQIEKQGRGGEHLPPEQKTHTIRSFQLFPVSPGLRRIKLPEYVDSDDEDLDLPGAVPHNRRGGDGEPKNCEVLF